MSKKVLLPMADGFEEIETVTIIDVLRRAGLEVVTAGTKAGVLLGSRCVKLIPDTVLESVKEEEFEMVVLPGGQPGVDNLRKHAGVLQILQKMSQRKKWVAAICAAPLILRDAGLIKNATLTSHPSVQECLPGVRYLQDRVVVEGRLITSRGPGTAMEFALKIVELLCDANKVRELSEAMLTKVA